MSQVIGFATEFYTLWDYQAENIYTTINGRYFLTGINHIYTYIKNISTNLSKAKALYPSADVDESLRGKTSSWERREKIDYPADVFPFGKLEGIDIATCDDVWQLTRTFEQDYNKRRRVIARRRLIELGELVKYTTFETIELKCEYTSLREDYSPADWGLWGTGKLTVLDGTMIYDTYQKRNNYVTIAEYNRLKNIEAKKAVPFLHTDGEKITIEIKLVYSTGYEGAYGYVYIENYISKDGNTYIYKGGSAPNISKEEFTKVTATVKHNEYNGVKQTLIQRVKIC